MNKMVVDMCDFCGDEGGLELYLDSHGNFQSINDKWWLCTDCAMLNNLLERMLDKFIEKNSKTETGWQIKKSGFARFLGKAGVILNRAYGEADANVRNMLLERHSRLDDMVDMCRKNVKTGFCRAVMGAYLLGVSPKQIEIELKEYGLWVECD